MGRDAGRGWYQHRAQSHRPTRSPKPKNASTRGFAKPAREPSIFKDYIECAGEKQNVKISRFLRLRREEEFVQEFIGKNTSSPGAARQQGKPDKAREHTSLSNLERDNLEPCAFLLYEPPILLPLSELLVRTQPRP